jgi:hypothetical protein
MKRCRPILAATMLCLPLVVWAQSFDQAWGIIESGGRSQTRRQEPVAITRIDGQSTRNPRRPDPVAPGKRTVVVRFSSARTVVGDQDRTIEVDVQPCKRYRVVAQLENAVSGTWEPVVAAPEDIGECRRRFLQPAKK